MKLAVELFVRQCAVCHQAKHTNTKPAGLLQPLPPPVAPWQEINMDFIEGLPLSDGADVTLIVVDRLTKTALYSSMAPLYSSFCGKGIYGQSGEIPRCSNVNYL
jgi:hypothetical protein